VDDCEPLLDAQSTELCFVLSGLSKLVGAPGLKLGWIVGRGRQASGFLDELELISDAFLSVNQAVQDGLGNILAEAPAIQRSIRDRLLVNRVLAHRILAGSAITPLPVRAGWSMIFRLPQLCDDTNGYELALKAGVRVQAGALYALPFANSIVVSLLTDSSQLGQGLSRLLAAVRSQTE
jgi:alanine-synthesizing transaminase